MAFSEDSLNVGQSFLNDYERSKFDAERLVHDFAAHGGSAFVYRLGNVSAHSRSGHFQRNAAENRLVHLLRACVKLRRVPDVAEDVVVLSPVDVVARSVLEISRSASVTGGTFHVDSPYELRFGDVFAALRRHGFVLQLDGSDGFAAFFRRHLDVTDEELTLAHFWAQRPQRRVRYRHARTHRLLDDLGVRFPRPDDEWLDGFVSSLVRSGALPRPPRDQEHPVRRRRTPCPTSLE